MGLLASGAVGALSGAGLLLPLEYWAQNLAFAYRSNRPPPHPYITHIDIDDNSLTRLGRWPWPRYRHAQAIESLCRLGAHTIMFDVEFPEHAQWRVERERLKTMEGLADQMGTLADRASEVSRTPGTDLAYELATAGSELHRLSGNLRTNREHLVHDDDAEVAQTLSSPEGFGRRVLFPSNLDEASRDLIRRSAAYGAARAALVRDFHASDETIGKGLGTAEAGQILKTVRTDVAFDALLARADADPDLMSLLDACLRKADDRLPSTEELDLLARAFGRPEAHPRSEARAALREAVERAIPFLTLERRFGHPPPKGLAPGSDGQIPGIAPVVRINPPIREYLDGIQESGYVSILPDIQIDGILRRVALLHQFRGRVYPQVALAALLRKLEADLATAELVPGRSLTIHPKLQGWGPIAIPIDERCQLVINWAGGVTRDPAEPLDFYHNFGKHVPYYKLCEIPDLLDATMQYANHMLADDLDHGLAVIAKQIKVLWWQLGEGQAAADATRLAKFEELVQRRTEAARATLATLPEGDKRTRIAAHFEQFQHCLDILRQNVTFLRERVKDKICIIGFTATASTDLKHIPYDPAFPGVGLHSNLINTILQQRWITPAPAWQNLGWLLVPGLLVALFAAYREPVPSAGFTLLVLLAVAGSFCFSFDRWGYWHHIVAPGLAVSGSLTAVSLYRQLTEGRQRREIKRAFSLYLHEAVIAEMETDPSKLSLGGQRRELTIFFSDVAGFTSISEKLSAEELVALLNEYLTAMSDIIMASGGTVDKYEGDAIMAFWGAPVPHADHARLACLAALDQQERLVELRARWRAEGRPELVCRMGLNTGPMVVGNMGSQNRFNYTVMGDAVNLGSRLEGANKAYETYIMIAESTYQQAREHIEARKLDLLRVKGKAQPVLVYELMGRKGALDPSQREMAGIYSEGLELYLQRRFKEAESMFTEALLLFPDDGPSKVYRQRALDYQQTPPPANWDGVHTLTTK